MERHNRDNYLVIGEGILTFGVEGNPITVRPSAIAEVRKFRFSRLGPTARAPLNDASRLILEEVAAAMTPSDAGDGGPDSATPAGYTYLAQFVDHDLTLDRTRNEFGQDVTVDELVQGRSPALDLDSLYGRGPDKDPRFYRSDGVRLRTGTTSSVPQGPGSDIEFARGRHVGFDLPRVGTGATAAERRQAEIPDLRNDENLAVAQTHLAFIRFHNRVVGDLAPSTPSAQLFSVGRERVVKHYQWMLRTDFLPRLIDPEIVADVFTNGRRFFEVLAAHNDFGMQARDNQDSLEENDLPTMPIEFSVAAYRFGHSLVRGNYEWNAVFNRGTIPASLLLLFAFSGTSGIMAPVTQDDPDRLNDPDIGGLVLPSNWVADFRRLYDFGEAGRDDLKVGADEFNFTKRIDTLLVNPLQHLPLGSFGGRDAVVRAAGRQLNLAFRNLTRAGMVRLASGQQMAEHLELAPLSPEQIADGDRGASLNVLADDQRNAFVADTPLWFYILREAELNQGRLTGVGGRIVAEVFHRAMEGSRASIVRDPTWRPDLGPDSDTFRMVDLLLFAFEGKKELLAPLG